jgi:hypothetical protein
MTGYRRSTKAHASQQRGHDDERAGQCEFESKAEDKLKRRSEGDCATQAMKLT